MGVKLKENEKRVLSYLIQDGRMQCTDIAKKLDISSQAVGKIKERLEKRGLITGYTAKVDYRKLGIDVFAIAFFRFKPHLQSKMAEEDLRKRIHGPHLLRVYRVNEDEYTHMVIYGFRNIRDLEGYFHTLQKEREHVSDLQKVYVLSGDGLLKDSDEDLLLKVIDELGKDILAKPVTFKPVPVTDPIHSGFFY